MSQVPKQLPEDEPATSASLPDSVDTTSTILSEEQSSGKSSSDLPMPRWVFNLVGHVLAGLLGLVLGYLILAWLRPLTFPLPWYH